MDANPTPPEIETPPFVPGWTGPAEVQAALADLDRRLRKIEVQFGLSTSREVVPSKGHPAGCRCLTCRKAALAP